MSEIELEKSPKRRLTRTRPPPRTSPLQTNPTPYIPPIQPPPTPPPTHTPYTPPTHTPYTPPLHPALPSPCISKGFLGECGLRGGYFELYGFDADVQAQLLKLASIGLCSNTVGQVATGLMVAPPKPGDASYASYKRERDGILRYFISPPTHPFLPYVAPHFSHISPFIHPQLSQAARDTPRRCPQQDARDEVQPATGRHVCLPLNRPTQEGRRGRRQGGEATGRLLRAQPSRSDRHHCRARLRIRAGKVSHHRSFSPAFSCTHLPYGTHPSFVHAYI